MKVERINLDGELGIVNSARVSFGKWKTELNQDDKKLIEYLKKHEHKSPFFHPQLCKTQKRFDLSKFTKTDIAGLEWYYNKQEQITFIRYSKYLYNKKKQLTNDNKLDNNIVFNQEWLLQQDDLLKASRMPYLSFRIKCPMFVRNQLDRHRVGFAINEISRRYVDTKPEFFKPQEWRKQSKNNKQGSINESIGVLKTLVASSFYHFALMLCKLSYQMSLKIGTCKEQARAILPTATITEFVWTGSLQDFARLCKARLKEDSQFETREVVKQIYVFCQTEYTLTFNKIIELID